MREVPETLHVNWYGFNSLLKPEGSYGLTRSDPETWEFRNALNPNGKEDIMKHLLRKPRPP